MRFDPDAAAQPGTGIFGLPSDRLSSRIILLPVPFDATTSYRRGTMSGPKAILDASMQVDLFDRAFGRVYEQGIFMEKVSPKIAALSRKAAALARPVIEAGGVEDLASAPARLRNALTKVNAISEQVNAFVYRETVRTLGEGKLPGLVGGEHSVPFGAVRAVAEHHKKVGLLHVDAHMDLRDSFEGFAWSHASIMHNVLKRIPGVKSLVQVGIRDMGEREIQLAESDRRVSVFYDADNARAMDAGTSWRSICRKAVRSLPAKVYVSFDIDGLDPSLCPHTGTPVPGGLSFNQACVLLEELKASGKQVVGFDLVEVAPGPSREPEWDANVGARILYKLCAIA